VAFPTLRKHSKSFFLDAMKRSYPYILCAVLLVAICWWFWRGKSTMPPSASTLSVAASATSSNQTFSSPLTQSHSSDANLPTPLQGETAVSDAQTVEATATAKSAIPPSSPARAVGGYGYPIAGVGSAQVLIDGAGATFPQPIYTKWFSEYSKVDPSVYFNYRGIGSGGGQKQILAETVDFGASDGPMSDANLAKAPRTLWHIPTLAGAVVVTYNLPGNPKLKLDGDTVVNIFLGKISKWNDSAITGQNPGVNLPSSDIVVLHRSDGSGTSFCFTDYLSSVSPEWKSKVGMGTAVSWPTGLGRRGNAGVADQMEQLPGAIGYIELAYARQNNLPYADIKNSSGSYITPTIESVTAALATATIPDDFRFSMVNAPGADAYPIATATWLLVYEQQKDAVKGRKLVEFLKWAFTNGQEMAASLDYVPLPDNVKERVLQRVGEIKY
jgi:phosphate transport system substrate-binding protein